MSIQIALSNSGRCQKCNGTGWIFETVEKMGYGLIEQAGRCPVCAGRRRLEENTGIPYKFMDTEYSTFTWGVYSRNMAKVKQITDDFTENYKRWQKEGKGLYLWSETPGSGKTFLASSIARTVMVAHDRQMRFITAPDYISRISENFNAEKGSTDPSEIYRECSLLVLDDIGAQKTGDWQRQELFRIVNTRMEGGLITIYTSNMAPENLNVDDRTIDRIIKSSVVIQMPEESIRRKTAGEEQISLLRQIGI